MESANVALRRELDLYANVRPVLRPGRRASTGSSTVRTPRANMSWAAAASKLRGLAMDFKVTTDAGTRRIARAAFEYAKNNGKTHVSIVTKANIMKKTDGKFSELCHEVAKDYPGITSRGLVHRHHDRQPGQRPAPGRNSRSLSCRTCTATSSPMRRPSCRAASAPRAAPISATNTPCSKPSTVPACA